MPWAEIVQICETAASSRTVDTVLIMNETLLRLQYLLRAWKLDRSLQQMGQMLKMAGEVGSVHSQLFDQTVASLVG